MKTMRMTAASLLALLIAPACSVSVSSGVNCTPNGAIADDSDGSDCCSQLADLTGVCVACTPNGSPSVNGDGSDCCSTVENQNGVCAAATGASTGGATTAGAASGSTSGSTSGGCGLLGCGSSGGASGTSGGGTSGGCGLLGCHGSSGGTLGSSGGTSGGTTGAAACQTAPAECSVDSDCCSQSCQSNSCWPVASGGPCETGADCNSGTCVNKLCVCSQPGFFCGGPGACCSTASTCNSGDTCTLPTTDQCTACKKQSDCTSGNDCVGVGDGGLVCAPDCTNLSSACAKGDNCAPLEGATAGTSYNVCIPAGGCTGGGSTGGAISTSDLCKACTKTGTDADCSKGNYCVIDPASGSPWCAPGCGTGTCPSADPCTNQSDNNNVNSYDVCYPLDTCG